MRPVVVTAIRVAPICASVPVPVPWCSSSVRGQAARRFVGPFLFVLLSLLLLASVMVARIGVESAATSSTDAAATDAASQTVRAAVDTLTAQLARNSLDIGAGGSGNNANATLAAAAPTINDLCNSMTLYFLAQRKKNAKTSEAASAVPSVEQINAWLVQANGADSTFRISATAAKTATATSETSPAAAATEAPSGASAATIEADARSAGETTPSSQSVVDAIAVARSKSRATVPTSPFMPTLLPSVLPALPPQPQPQVPPFPSLPAPVAVPTAPLFPAAATAGVGPGPGAPFGGGGINYLTYDDEMEDALRRIRYAILQLTYVAFRFWGLQFRSLDAFTGPVNSQLADVFAILADQLTAIAFATLGISGSLQVEEQAINLELLLQQRELSNQTVAAGRASEMAQQQNLLNNGVDGIPERTRLLAPSMACPQLLFGRWLRLEEETPLQSRPPSAAANGTSTFATAAAGTSATAAGAGAIGGDGWKTTSVLLDFSPAFVKRIESQWRAADLAAAAASVAAGSRRPLVRRRVNQRVWPGALSIECNWNEAGESAAMAALQSPSPSLQGAPTDGGAGLLRLLRASLSSQSLSGDPSLSEISVTLPSAATSAAAAAASSPTDRAASGTPAAALLGLDDAARWSSASLPPLQFAFLPIVFNGATYAALVERGTQQLPSSDGTTPLQLGRAYLRLADEEDALPP